jgi:outer membrane biosynthesis protein TonB
MRFSTEDARATTHTLNDLNSWDKLAAEHAAEEAAAKNPPTVAPQPQQEPEARPKPAPKVEAKDPNATAKEILEAQARKRKNVRLPGDYVTDEAKDRDRKDKIFGDNPIISPSDFFGR